MLGRLLGTIDYHLDRAEENWLRRSVEWRQRGYGILRRWIVGRAGHPLSLPTWLLLVAGGWTMAAILPVPDGLGWIIGRHLPDDVVTYFGAVWSAQVAIAVLVYPIVIAFVTILLQREQSTKASLYVYLHDSAAISAGLSALLLVGLMAIQYLGITYVGRSTVVGWISADTSWFLVNLLLTGFFLYRTFEFVLPSRRLTTIRRFAVSVAWPREVRFHLAAQLFLNAVSAGLIPGPAYGSDVTERRPSILMGSYGIDTGTKIVEKPTQRSLYVTRIWFRPLSWVASRWLRRAGRTQAQDHREAAVLNFPVGLGDEYAPGDSLCRIAGSETLRAFEKIAVRLAYGFRNGAQHGIELTANDIFAEIQADAMDALNRGEEENFSAKVSDFCDLFELLVSVSVVQHPNGRAENYSAIPDRNHWLNRPAYEVWGRRFLDLAEAAAKRLTLSDAFFLRMSYAVRRLYAAALSYGDSEMARYCINLPSASFRYFGLWWTRLVEEQGGAGHEACAPQVLREPYGASHENVMREFVGAWESLKNDFFPPRRTEGFTWDDYGLALPSYTRHLLETGVMLTKSVTLGDTLSAEWLASVLTNWYEQMESRFDTYHAYQPKEQSAHLGLISGSWDAAKENLEIVNELGGVNPTVVFAACLRNYRADVACAIAYILVLWGRDCPCEQSLPARIVKLFVRGGQTRRGAEPIRAVASLTTANDLLAALFRQNYSIGDAGAEYKQMLDGVVRSVAGTRARNMVPGRIYGSLGGNEGLDGLCDGWIVLLAALVPEHWRPMMAVGTTLRELSAKDNELFRRCIRDLGVWIDRLRADDLGDYRPAYECISALNDKQRPFNEALDAARQGIESLLYEAQQIQDGVLHAAVIDEARLQEIGRWSSALAFAKDTAGVPVSLFETVGEVAEDGDQSALLLPGMEKGRFTRPEFVQRPINEEEWFGRIMRNHVSVVVLRDLVAKLKPTLQVVHGAAAYWTALKRYGAELSGQHLTGALLVHSLSSPGWLAHWMRTYGRDESLIPADLELTRTDAFERIDGYFGNIGGVAVFQAPVERDESYLFPLQALKDIVFARLADHRYVEVGWENVEGDPDRVTLKLSWRRSTTVDHYDAVRLSIAPNPTGTLIAEPAG